MTGCQAELPPHSDHRCAVASYGTSIVLDFDSYGVNQRSHAHIVARLQAEPHITTLKIIINQANIQQPEHLYHYLRGFGVPVLQFVPFVALDDVGALTTESVHAEQWGAFLIAVFDLWVQQDIETLHIQYIDAALAIWCGQGSPFSGDNALLVEECRECPVLRFCHGDSPQHRIANDGKSALCAGYRQFFTYSAPYMKALRDLLKQHRSPVELMAILAQSR